MKKLLLIIAGAFFSLLIGYFLVFLIQPSLILDFYIYPSDLEAPGPREVFFEIKPFSIDIQFTHTGNFKFNDLSWSPNKKYVAFFERILEPAENPYDREWALKIINPRTFKMKTIFIGDNKIGKYQWLDDYTIRAYINPCAQARAYRDISINISEPFVVAEHKSPEFWVPVKN
ncbi:MAG: hypothetical protein COU82_00540 [Candidatus Portnoybacteria bacterium CG10_big_fil_rev_8_21_14_0_10_38_18]|uniref:Uncharacterized protein n=1 Tax=Candidatus Portnoybacteria bacterium CG10_big_fil_rev_8_21_14_0_10_38_18 TaxID=1974813 RepID=A0A2M8KCS2_9BACT|nr:MAG: hypothetical protein COU82_00540 [Candidatus Portnoybacteria bacterium CG10_big_fil_rev_8_21_14_0_10_38_18]